MNMADNWHLKHLMPQNTTLIILPSIVIVYFTFNAFRRLQRRRRYDRKRQQRQNEVNDVIERLERRVEDIDPDGITKLSLFDIKEQLVKGTLTAVQVLQAFQAKAIKVHRETNCLVEPVREAESVAAAWDADKKDGLLAGIPVSIKDHIAIKDYVTTAGASYYLGKVTQEDSALVKILRKQGAIIFVRTNQPQTGLSLGSGNPIYGTVGNPHDPTRNPGGSSSGEGALIGGGGSLLGFGSDIGGSIRVPAHFSGCCGFKPTSERVSHLGMRKLLCEEGGIPLSYGPLARDVDSLVLAMKALWDGSMSDLDPLSPPMVFQNVPFESKKPMKVGYFIDNGLFAPTPVSRRSVLMAVEELRKQGHEVEEWLPPGADAVDVMVHRALAADAGEELLHILEDDKIDECIKTLYMSARLPHVIKVVIAKILSYVSEKDSALAKAIDGCGSVHKYWQLERELKGYQEAVSKAWHGAGYDAVICPPLPFPALPIGQTDITMRAGSYSVLYNVLNFPAGVVHMTKQSKSDIEALKDYPIRDRFHRQVKDFTEDAEGLPVGVMVASLRWQDEKCLRVMKAIEKASDFTVT